MQTVPLTKMTIPPNRHRKTFRPEALEELCKSIRTKGLFHPIVVRELEGKNGPLYQLVAGHRRLIAITRLHEREHLFDFDDSTVKPGEVPIVRISDSNAITRREAELEENVIREDLTWQEKTQALDEIHQLRKAQDPEQKYVDTGKELAAKTPDKDQVKATRQIGAEISRAEVIAPYLDDPEVARARNEREAYSIVSRKIEAEFAAGLMEAMPEKIQTKFLIEGDLIEELPNMDVEQFDLIIADPPYGIGADEFGTAAKKAHTYKDDARRALDIADQIFCHSFNAAKRQAHLYLFCDIEHFLILRGMAEQAGWTPWRTPYVYYKGSVGHNPIPGLGPRRTTELILFCNKGQRPVRYLADDCITIRTREEKRHAAQKPADLYTYLINLSCEAGDTVLDPCCGSGTIFLASDQTKTIVTGVEKDLAMVAECKRIIMEGEEDG